jgi:hypothetical protein
MKLNNKSKAQSCIILCCSHLRNSHGMKLYILTPAYPCKLSTGTIHFQLSHVWFDRISISPDAPEHTDTLECTTKDVTNFIRQEVVHAGIPERRIIVGKMA